MRKFEYIKPSTIEEASEILTKYKDKAKILNGGTDLLVRMRDNLIKPEYVVDIKGLHGMRHIGLMDDGSIFIGSAVTLNELSANNDILNNYRILAESAHEVGSFQLRNRATLAGNVCNASPSGDTLPALYVLEAMVKVYIKGSEKLIPVEDFILGVRKIALDYGEIVTGIYIPKLHGKSCGAYYKHSRRKDVDLSTAGAAVFYSNGCWRVCFGAVAETPVRGRKTEVELNNLKGITEEGLAPVLNCAVSEISPISDARASREYRLEMTKIALKRAAMRANDILMNSSYDN